jgi:hypothetical protein
MDKYVTCGSCWFADYNPKLPHRHAFVEEPDIFANMKPGDEPPMIRVIKSCYAKQTEYVMKGLNGQHTCGSWQSYEQNFKIAEQQDAIERARWPHATERTQLPFKVDLFECFTLMAESHGPAFDMMFDMVGVLQDATGEVLQDLNDMNIRGEQMPLALKFAGDNLHRLAALAKERNKALVAYVNENYNYPGLELAVTSGAHRNGHKPITSKRAAAG